MSGEAPQWTPRLGAHVAAARQRAGLTRGQLAERVGVTEESVRRWEQGWTAPSAERLARLLVVLAIDAAAFAPPTPQAERRGAAATSPGETPIPELARRLREERRARGISQAAAARTLGVAQATYAGWETGRARPDRRWARRLAAFLGATPMELARHLAAPARSPEVLSPLGEVVAARRMALGLTRAALAAAVGVSPRTLGAWERGEKVPRAGHLRRLAERLGVAPAELLAAVAAGAGPAPEAGAVREPAPTRLGALIERERRARGLTREELAARADLAPSTLTRWATGRHRPIPAKLRRLAAVLDLDPEEVVAAAKASGW